MTTFHTQGPPPNKRLGIEVDHSHKLCSTMWRKDLVVAENNKLKADRHRSQIKSALEEVMKMKDDVARYQALIEKQVTDMENLKRQRDIEIENLRREWEIKNSQWAACMVHRSR